MKLRNCPTCGKETKNPKFCSMSCSAKQTNKEHPKRGMTKTCANCSNLILSKLKFCSDDCEYYWKRHNKKNVGEGSQNQELVEKPCLRCGNTTYEPKIYCSETCCKQHSHELKLSRTEKICGKCFECKPKECYQIDKKGSWHSWCKQCHKTDAYNKKKNLKILAIAYKGGCCSKCGYNKNYSALDFHHVDPSQKDFAFGGAKGTVVALTEKIKNELDKCILVCANCHRETHNPDCILNPDQFIAVSSIPSNPPT